MSSFISSLWFTVYRQIWSWFQSKFKTVSESNTCLSVTDRLCKYITASCPDPKQILINDPQNIYALLWHLWKKTLGLGQLVNSLVGYLVFTVWISELLSEFSKSILCNSILILSSSYPHIIRKSQKLSKLHLLPSISKLYYLTICLFTVCASLYSCMDRDHHCVNFFTTQSIWRLGSDHMAL